jgi:DMSO/TMAO reductase YedYZ molybdopterin-dependent catalytic subunit
MFNKKMKRIKKYNLFITIMVMLAMVFAMNCCESKNPEGQDPQGGQDPDDTDELLDFPAFITPVEKYFDLSIGSKPLIDGDAYRLKISGAVDNPASFSLAELRNIKMIEQTLTVECIENQTNGNLIGTATWKGFDIHDLLEDLGIQESVTFVQYICADGYFTYNTLEELQNSNVLGALYMNDDPIPQKFGFPLRIIFPGYYGVRQPGWVVEIALLVSGTKDFWGESQFLNWHTDSTMTVDSKIFFPANRDTLTVGENVRIGGAAYGSKRISKVEITVDDGKTWIPATKVQEMDLDYVWVFWEVNYTPQSTGALTIRARATAGDGRIQSRDDPDYLDGTNSWPRITVSVED